MKYFWYLCKEKATGAEQKVCILAKSWKQAEEKISENLRYIPLQYLGWTPVTEEDQERKEPRQLTIYDFIEEEE